MDEQVNEETHALLVTDQGVMEQAAVPGVPAKPPVVVITGASAGLGRATAREFARKGASIGLIARGLEGLEATRKEVEDLGGKALICQGDVADYATMERAAEAVELEFGPIDVWVNNAMVSVFSPVKDMTPEDFHRVTDVTYLGYVHGTLAALKRMLPRDRGTIIQVGSALAYRGIPLQSAYCAAKHAIQGFNDSLRTELLHDQSKIHVTMIQMPALNTPQFRWSKSRMPRKAQPVPPIFQPEVGARAIVYAADHHPREMKVGFPTSKAVFGNRIAPGILDQYLADTGYESQMTNALVDPAAPNNLMAPVPGDHGAHGPFDHIANGQSTQFWVRTHRAQVGMAVGALALAWVLLGRRTRKQ
jgi:NAD(P)-dependent dehydrogenase (short-subunit alcohol dehydrogenase family)